MTINNTDVTSNLGKISFSISNVEENVSQIYVSEGDTIVFNVNANEGYTLGDLRVYSTGDINSSLGITKISETQYSVTMPPKTIRYKARSLLSAFVASAVWTQEVPPRHRPLHLPYRSEIPCRSLLFDPFPASGTVSFLPTLSGTLRILPSVPSQIPRYPRSPSAPHKGATNPVQCYIRFSCSLSSNPFLNMVPAR